VLKTKPVSPVPRLSLSVGNGDEYDDALVHHKQKRVRIFRHSCTADDRILRV